MTTQTLEVERTDVELPAKDVTAVALAQEAPRSARQTVVREERETAKPVVFERAIVQMSPEISLLVAALAKAQGAFEDVTKTKNARIESRKEGGRSYSYDYETLADVIRSTRKGLSDNGLAVMQFPFPGRDTLTLRTMLAHESGQWISNDLSATIDGLSPQAVASTTTYLMRYARKAILGVAADDEDDDAQAGQAQASVPRPAQRESERKAQQVMPSNVGKVVSVSAPNANGGVKVTLDSGFAAATGDPELISALKGLQDSGQVVEVTYRPSSDMARFLPVVTEIARRK